MADIVKPQPRRERAIAAWESALARTLNPHLSEAQGKKVWDLVLKNREKPDAVAFAKGLSDVLDGAPTPIRHSADMLVANLEDVLKIKE